MKKLACAVACTVFLGWAGIAAATPSPVGAFFTEDANYVQFDKNNKSYTWTFDLDNDPVFSAMQGPGYGQAIDINAEDTISKAWLSIFFYDDEKDKKAEEYATVKLDGKKYFQNMEIDSQMYSFAGIETLLTDHVLSVTVKRNSGDFGVCNVTLGGTYIDNSPVPEPTTMLLFGTGLAGLAAVGRRKKK